MGFASIIRKIKIPFNYNIGFVNLTPRGLIKKGSLGEISWMKHNYSDRFFADPFILTVDNERIVVLVEELIYGRKGTIVELVVDRRTKHLIDRRELLRLNTHLSYPNIFRYEGHTYVMPENSEAGEIKLYEYINNDLRAIKTVIAQGVNDATFIRHDGEYYLLATKIKPDCNKDAYLFKSDSPTSEWQQVGDTPVVTNERWSRPGGGFFEVDGKTYRVAQDCKGLYGNSMHIRQVTEFIPFRESEVIHLKPTSYRYSKGLHTLNFHESGLAVVDGNGYYYPTLGRLFSPVFKLYYFLRRNI